MKIKALIAALQRVVNENPNATVVLSTDNEGNGYAPLMDVEQYGKKVILWPSCDSVQDITEL